MNIIIFILGLCSGILLFFHITDLISKQRLNSIITKAKKIINQNKVEAIKLLTKVINTDRTHPEALWLLAQLYSENDQLLLAEITLQDLLYSGRLPKSTSEDEIHLFLADIYERKGEYRKAAAEYFILQKVSHLTPAAAAKAARLSLSHNQIKEAEIFLKEGYKKDPKNPEILFLLGKLEFYQMNFKKSLEYLKSARKEGWERFETKLFLIKTFFMLGNFLEALNEMKDLTPSEISKAALEDILGESALSLEDNPEAIKTLEDLIQQFKTTPNAPVLANLLFVLGTAYEAAGKIENAIKCWKDSVNFFDHGPSKSKISFYEGPGSSEIVKKFLTSSLDKFQAQCLVIIDRLNFQVTDALPAVNTRWLNFICKNIHDMHPYHKTLVHINRRTSVLNEEEINNLLRLTDDLRAKNLVIIAVLFSQDTLKFCESKGILLYSVLEILLK